MISETTEKDWDDFWKSEDVVNSYLEYLDDEHLELKLQKTEYSIFVKEFKRKS
jgi:hypothetical protein